MGQAVRGTALHGMGRGRHRAIRPSRRTLMRVAIIDYGSGNLRSATKPFERAAREAGIEAVIDLRSEEHTSELQSLMRHSYAVFCLKKQKPHTARQNRHI